MSDRVSKGRGSMIVMEGRYSRDRTEEEIKCKCVQLSIAAARIEGRSKNMIFLDVCVKHGVSVQHLKHVFFCESAFCLVGRCAFTQSIVFA